MHRYPIYGGPFNGREAEEAATIYADRPNLVPPFQSTNSKGIEPPPYIYDLTETEAGKVFMPREDRDLMQAYNRTNRERGDPETDALLGEIGKRNLEL